MQPRVRCRQIGDGDLDAVVALLRRGFPGRPRHYWTAGFERQKARALPPGAPRYGFMLESEGRAVGVILLLFRSVDVAGEARTRCNLSSWYVDPEFRAHASSLIFFAMKDKRITYVNISPARHTLPTIEAQGFVQYAGGQFFSVPALRRGVAGSRIHRIPADLPRDRFAALPERDLLVDHAAMGCLSLVVEASDGLHPFVFLPFHIRSGRVALPIRQLIFCRDIAEFLRFSGPIGRFLLARGIPFVVHDSNAAVKGLVGHFRPFMGTKYFRGPDRPCLGDLAYTERVIFGP